MTFHVTEDSINKAKDVLDLEKIFVMDKTDNDWYPAWKRIPTSQEGRNNLMEIISKGYD